MCFCCVVVWTKPKMAICLAEKQLLQACRPCWCMLCKSVLHFNASFLSCRLTRLAAAPCHLLRPPVFTHLVDLPCHLLRPPVSTHQIDLSSFIARPAAAQKLLLAHSFCWAQAVAPPQISPPLTQKPNHNLLAGLAQTISMLLS